MNSDLEEIKSRLNIVDVLGEYIRLDKAGANWRALCPFHNEKSPSFMVSEEKQMWKCFGCGKGGDIFSFVMEIEGLEFREALKQLAEKAGVPLKSYNPKKAEEKNRTLEILELATKFYETQLWKGEGQRGVLNYLRERGLKDETIKEFRLGYAPRGWRNALTFLIKRGYRIDEIKKTGLLVEKSSNANLKKIPNPNDRNPKQPTTYPPAGEAGNLQPTNYYDRFRDRIIFPVADYSGKIVGFSARVTPGQDESQAKYVNTPETEVYHKSKVLYGLDKARREIKQRDFVLLVEGNMDVIAASQAGIKNTVAVSGTALTEEQVGIIKRYTDHVKMFFDADKAGEIATVKSVKLGLAKDLSVQIVNLPFGKDAAELARSDPKKLISAVDNSRDVMEHLLEKAFSRHDKNKAEGKRNIAEEILDMISNLANAVEKSHWIKKLGEKLGSSETALTDMLRKVSLRNRAAKSRGVQTVENDIVSKKKIEILTDELIGLMLVCESGWKKISQAKPSEIFLLKDSLLEAMVLKGKEVNYNSEKLAEVLPDSESIARVDKIFFQKKFWLDLNNNLEEVVVEKPEEELEKCWREIKIELKKEELGRISADLKLAEEKKDKAAMDFLKREFKKVTQEMVDLK